MNHQNSLMTGTNIKLDMAKTVVDLAGFPVDEMAVYILLESMGYNDDDARSQTGCSDLKDLADQVYQICSQHMYQFMIIQNQFSNTRRLQKILNNLPANNRGFILMLPVAAQLAALIIFGFSLWTSLHFTQIEATIVSLSSFMSLIVTGGIVQAMSREGIFYQEQENENTAGNAVFLTYRFGILLIIVFMLLFTVSLPALNIVTVNKIFVFNMYFGLLALLWLNMSVEISFSEYLSVSIITTLGIIPVYLVMHFTGFGIYVAHWTGLITANVLFWVNIAVRHPGRDRTTGLSYNEKKIIIHRSLAFITAGMLFFLFFFIDRMISWSVYTPNPDKLLFLFRMPYELGMDWALLVFFLNVCLLEVFINRLCAGILNIQEKYSISDIGMHNSYFKEFYHKQFLSLIMIGLASILLTYLLAIIIRKTVDSVAIAAIFNDSITLFTFFIAAFSYLFLSLSLLNGLLFFTIAKPEFVLKSIVPALIVNLITGFYFSRTISYEYGVLGLLAGSITYCIVSTSFAFKVFHQLDYYYYSGY